MNNFSVTDIEIIRARSELSYEEAMDLLEHHDGSIAAALTDLEMNGRLKEPAREEKKEDVKMDTQTEKVYTDADRERSREEARACAKAAGCKVRDFLKKLCRIRLNVSRQDRQMFDLPLPLCVLFAMVSFPLTVTAVILGVIFGYSFRVDTNGVTF